MRWKTAGVLPNVHGATVKTCIRPFELQCRLSGFSPSHFPIPPLLIDFMGPVEARSFTKRRFVQT